MTRIRRASSLAMAAVLCAQPLLAQTVVSPVPATLGAQPLAGAAAAAPLSAPSATLALAPKLILGTVPKINFAAGGGLLARLKALAPRLLGPLAAQTLDQVYSNAAPATEPAEPVRPAAPKLGFEEFARAGAQAFYEGRLAAGEYGAVVSGPRVARPEGALPDSGEMQRRMELPTLSNPQREEKGIELFQLAGAGAQIVDVGSGQAPPLERAHTILRQDAGRNRHNLIVVKPGRRSDQVIVVGAHHDKVSAGEGKIDNWGGATMMANLYQAMKDVDTESTYVFVMFAREEEGLLGSEAYVRALKPEQRRAIKAMVNVDTVGVDGTFSWKNNSTRWLLDLIAKVAKDEKLDLTEAYLNGGDADSSTFKRFTPAMTIFGASQDVIFDIIHSDNDNMKAFNLSHYVNTARLTLALLKALDSASPGGRIVASPSSGGSTIQLGRLL